MQSWASKSALYLCHKMLIPAASRQGRRIHSSVSAQGTSLRFPLGPVAPYTCIRSRLLEGAQTHM
jgi:hypothetical protein